jgi:ParB family chromosome partitioning protein
MHLMKVDPRALKENPDRARQTRSSAQADALLLATIKAVGIVQPPVIAPAAGGGNAYIINSGHRRVRQAIAAGLEEIEVLVDEAANDNGAMRSLVENTAREPLNPVDQWRAIERLVALTWTEDAIGIALSLPLRQVQKLRLLAHILPSMLDHIAKGDMPNEKQLRTIAAASLDEQKEVWKKYKPSKADPQVAWYNVANGLEKTRMHARDASFGEDLAQAYGIQWVEDLFASADEDSRYTTDVEAFLGAQQEWMTQHLPKRGVIVEADTWGRPKLPPKADRIYGKPGKSDHAAMYLDREGKVQTIHYRLPEPKKAKGRGDGSAGESDVEVVVSKARPDVTRKGIEMIGDLRTDALHEALARAPIEDDTLLALLILAFAGRNITIASGTSGEVYGYARMDRHASQLVGADGKLAFDRETLQQVARGVLIDVLSCRENRTDSGIVARLAGDAIGADGFLVNMGTEDFLSCLSRPALEGSCRNTPVLPRQKVKDTRAALAAHFTEERFIYRSALFAPDAEKLTGWLAKHEASDSDDLGDQGDDPEAHDQTSDHAGFREAAE